MSTKASRKTKRSTITADDNKENENTPAKKQCSGLSSPPLSPKKPTTTATFVESSQPLIDDEERPTTPFSMDVAEIQRPSTPWDPIVNAETDKTTTAADAAAAEERPPSPLACTCVVKLGSSIYKNWIDDSLCPLHDDEDLSVYECTCHLHDLYEQCLHHPHRLAPREGQEMGTDKPVNRVLHFDADETYETKTTSCNCTQETDGIQCTQPCLQWRRSPFAADSGRASTPVPTQAPRYRPTSPSNIQFEIRTSVPHTISFSSSSDGCLHRITFTSLRD